MRDKMAFTDHGWNQEVVRDLLRIAKPELERMGLQQDAACIREAFHGLTRNTMHSQTRSWPVKPFHWAIDRFDGHEDSLVLRHALGCLCAHYMGKLETARNRHTELLLTLHCPCFLDPLRLLREQREIITRFKHLHRTARAILEVIDCYCERCDSYSDPEDFRAVNNGGGGLCDTCWHETL